MLTKKNVIGHGELRVAAIRGITVGEELYLDYGPLYWSS